MIDMAAGMPYSGGAEGFRTGVFVSAKRAVVKSGARGIPQQGSSETRLDNSFFGSHMLYAQDFSGQKILATPGAHALCPFCQAHVIAKTGEINAWHWAHEINSVCDWWSEGETDWHLAWKRHWPAEQVEMTIERNGVQHRADIVTSNGAVIELQHSSIDVAEIQEREHFYSNIIWVFDVREPYREDRLLFRNKNNNVYTFRWKHAKKHIAYTTHNTFLDLGGALIQLKKMYPEAPVGGWGIYVSLSDFLRRYGGQ